MSQQSSGNTQIQIAIHDGLNTHSLGDVYTSPDINIPLPTTHPVQVQLIDFDRDGDQDILLLIREFNKLKSQLQLLRNNGSSTAPSFSPTLENTTFPDLFVDGSIGIIDFNLDGFDDVFTCDIFGSVIIYLNQGANQFTSITTPPIFSNLLTRTSFTTDVDDNGQKEIIAFNLEKGLQFLLHDGSSWIEANQIKRNLFDPFFLGSQYYELTGGDFFDSGSDGLFLNATNSTENGFQSAPWYFPSIRACFSTYDMSVTDASINGTLSAAQQIQTQGSFTINPGPLTLNAPNIQLNAGITIDANTTLIIKTAGCVE